MLVNKSARCRYQKSHIWLASHRFPTPAIGQLVSCGRRKASQIPCREHNVDIFINNTLGLLLPSSFFGWRLQMLLSRFSKFAVDASRKRKNYETKTSKQL